MADWEEIGYIHVDAGIVMVGDPCYTLPDDATHRGKEASDWGALGDALYPPGYQTEMKHHHEIFGEGLGIIVQSGFGDGTYPVLVKRNPEGRVMKLLVDFGDETEIW